MPEFQDATLPIDSLLLDPNNYRFQDSPDYVYADEQRFHESSVQDRAYRRLRSDSSLGLLKNSILHNGFIPVDKLIVRVYEHSNGKHVVLEGNRRLAALKWIKEDIAAGITTETPIADTLQAVPVIVVGHDEASFFPSLMGIRHVSGVQQWGGYQRAKLVADLRDTHQLDAADVADRLGMQTREVNRRYRAFKALEQMSDSEDFGDFAGPEAYPLFHEALAIPAVRDWLGWSADTNSFSNDEELEKFYELIAPHAEDAEDDTRKDNDVSTGSGAEEHSSQH